MPDYTSPDSLLPSHDKFFLGMRGKVFFTCPGRNIIQVQIALFHNINRSAKYGAAVLHLDRHFLTKEKVFLHVAAKRCVSSGTLI